MKLGIVRFGIAMASIWGGIVFSVAERMSLCFARGHLTPKD